MVASNKLYCLRDIRSFSLSVTLRSPKLSLVLRTSAFASQTPINGPDFISISLSRNLHCSRSLKRILSLSLSLVAWRRSMADHDGDHETLVEKILEKIHDHDDSSSSSSSDSDDGKSKSFDSAESKIFRLFGREKPLHKVLGGGKSADVFLWRNKKISAGALGGATALWILFELLGYHLVTLVCHILIVSLAILFLWSNACTFINKSPPRIPELRLPENFVLEVVSTVRIEINFALAVLRDIASGRDLKEFLGVIAGLWVLSLVGKWFNFLTLFYIAFVLLHTLPVLYEKYEDHVDSFAEKATVEIKKQYVVFDAKVLSKIPKGPLKDMKKD